MMIGIAMAIVENGTTNQNYLSMLKGYEMANSQQPRLFSFRLFRGG